MLPQANDFIKKFPRGLRLLRWFFEQNQQNVRTVDELALWLSAHASHVAQSSMYAYTRARLGLMMGKAFSEEIFSRALFEAALRAQYYVIGDLTLLTAHCYRMPSKDSAEQFQRAFQQVFSIASAQIALTTYQQTLDNNKDNDSLTEEELEDLALVVPLSIADVQTEARSHFEIMLPIVLTPQNEAIGAKEIARFSATKVFELIPLSSQMKYLDEEMVINNTTFRMMRFYEDISRDRNRQKFISILQNG